MLFLVEGGDGAGKTTFCNALKDNIGSKAEIEIYSGLLPNYKAQITKDHSNADKLAIMLKSFDDIINILFTNENKEKITILDRFLPSAFAYQIYSSLEFTPDIGLDHPYAYKEMLESYKRLNKYFYNNFSIKIIYLTVSPQTAISRIKERKGDILDDYYIDNINTINKGYDVYFKKLKAYLEKEYLSRITINTINTENTTIEDCLKQYI